MNVSDQNMAHLPLTKQKLQPVNQITDIPVPKPRKVDDEFL